MDHSLSDSPAVLDQLGQMIEREHLHRNVPAPMLDALLPILEYTPEQLRRGGFLDSWLGTSIRAYGRIQKAASYLKPLGIHEADLCLILRERMKEQIKLQKARCAISRSGRKAGNRRHNT